jgi:mono/diheme cytochrome c family protein
MKRSLNRAYSWPKVGGAVLSAVLIIVNNSTWAQESPSPGECPQPRFTDKAPPEIYRLHAPLRMDKKVQKTADKLYQETAKPIPCARCHGLKGDGKGRMANMFDPPPRNFACAETVNGIPDGQLFWIIKNGSPGTSMPSFKTLDDLEIWMLVLYLRHLVN